jgi:hypothetical protein
MRDCRDGLCERSGQWSSTGEPYLVVPPGELPPPAMPARLDDRRDPSTIRFVGGVEPEVTALTDGGDESVGSRALFFARVDAVGLMSLEVEQPPAVSRLTRGRLGGTLGDAEASLGGKDDRDVDNDRGVVERPLLLIGAAVGEADDRSAPPCRGA